MLGINNNIMSFSTVSHRGDSTELARDVMLQPV